METRSDRDRRSWHFFIGRWRTDRFRLTTSRSRHGNLEDDVVLKAFRALQERTDAEERRATGPSWIIFTLKMSETRLSSGRSTGSSPPSDTTFSLVNVHIVSLSCGLC
jgi:hypothetical protein